MPLQNRVDPFGELCAVHARGMLMGNRGGRFHRDDRTLGARRHASRQWISCECAFKGRQRDVWGRFYTELFFLDEVTALAAGHRPCFECRRADAQAFTAAFPFARDQERRARGMDIRLHGERLNGGRKRLHVMNADSLPDGVMIARDGMAYALSGGHMLPWSHQGYGAPVARIIGMADILTPPSIIAALQNGFAPRWHESVRR